LGWVGALGVEVEPVAGWEVTTPELDEWLKGAWALPVARAIFENVCSATASCRAACRTRRRMAAQLRRCSARHLFRAFVSDASSCFAPVLALAATATSRGALELDELALALAARNPIATIAITSKDRHLVTSSCQVRPGRERCVNIDDISFGSWAVCVRPLALRTRLATGVPLSGICRRL
jgi:hypothetical protein